MVDGMDLYEIYRDAMYRSDNDHSYAVEVVEHKLDEELATLREEIMDEFSDVMREEE